MNENITIRVIFVLKGMVEQDRGKEKKKRLKKPEDAMVWTR